VPLAGLCRVEKIISKNIQNRFLNNKWGAGKQLTFTNKVMVWNLKTPISTHTLTLKGSVLLCTHVSLIHNHGHTPMSMSDRTSMVFQLHLPWCMVCTMRSLYVSLQNKFQ
jgi:hypothetical protein